MSTMTRHKPFWLQFSVIPVLDNARFSKDPNLSGHDQQCSVRVGACLQANLLGHGRFELQMHAHPTDLFNCIVRIQMRFLPHKRVHNL